MPPLTRRRALLAAAAGVAGLSGCNSGSTDRPTIDYREDDGLVDDYDVRKTRNTDGAVLFAHGEELPTVADDQRGRHTRSSRSVVVSEEKLADLTFGEVPEAERLRSFATATDFDTASLYLFAMPVEACYEIRLRSVSAEWDGSDATDLHPHADFCQTTRPADVDCDVDAVHTVGFAIRLPVAAKQSHGSGRGMSSSCGPSPRGEYFEARVTPADGGAGE